MKEKIAEINQKWQKTDKNDRKTGKMWSFTNYHLPSSHFCPAKLPFLSCQDPISVLPRSHFCPAKLTNFSRGGPRPPRPPPSYAYDSGHNKMRRNNITNSISCISTVMITNMVLLTDSLSFVSNIRLDAREHSLKLVLVSGWDTGTMQ